MRELFRRQPKFSQLAQGEETLSIPDDLWTKCPKCNELQYSKDAERLLFVCPRCGHHARLTARQRIDALVDAGTFTEFDAQLKSADPLDFVANGDAYRDKTAAAARKTGSNDALVCGNATIAGEPVSLAVTEFGFLGASMGSVYGEKLVRAMERAIDDHRGLVTVSSSGGARMHESMFSLMQMAKTTAALAHLGDAKLPHIAILTDPCYGGVTASYATVADVIVAEPGAIIGFAGPRVIEQVTRQKLPEGFQTAEFLLDHGMIDLVVERAQLPERIGTLLRHFHEIRNNQEPVPVATTIDSGAVVAIGRVRG
ncbi:MAG: acetyl-CoA carboxylase, carboxyltransferase subunit beta [Nitrolancea sp.]